MNTTNSQQTHAPSHLREDFQEWLDSYEPNRLNGIDTQPVASLLGALADCGDVLPADYCDQLEIPKGSTYAEAVADVRQWCATKQGQPAAEPALESLDEAKARWDSLLGMVSTPQKDGFILSSPTGFPLATMEISEVPGGKYIPCFGQPIGAQSEWIKKHQDRKVPERSAEDVYWEYVEKVGEEAIAETVLHFLDRDIVVQMVLDCLDANDLDEYLYGNFVAEVQHA